MISEKPVTNSPNLCVICQDDILSDTQIAAEKAKKLGCEHIFHEDCINAWLQRKHQCPVCRKPVNNIDTPEVSFIPEMSQEEVLSLSNQRRENNQPFHENAYSLLMSRSREEQQRLQMQALIPIIGNLLLQILTINQFYQNNSNK